MVENRRGSVGAPGTTSAGDIGRGDGIDTSTISPHVAHVEP
jgi:hypothetical protein